jgi:hypothetical protein
LKWEEAQQKEFDELKMKLTTAPVLHFRISARHLRLNVMQVELGLEAC